MIFTISENKKKYGYEIMSNSKMALYQIENEYYKNRQQRTFKKQNKFHLILSYLMLSHFISWHCIIPITSQWHFISLSWICLPALSSILRLCLEKFISLTLLYSALLCSALLFISYRILSNLILNFSRYFLL